ncbi:MAG: M15 family metallopeptidase [Spirochaetaceae bacterium]|nr:M15 family metallopeptidase [Spirochaetaceae bacterium]
MIKKKIMILCLIIFFSIIFLFCIDNRVVTKNSDLYDLEISPSSTEVLPSVSPHRGRILEFSENKEMPDEVKALYRAYSNFIDEIKYVNDDWLITIRGVDLYWAGGKLLPPNKKTDEDKYRSYGFYKYPDELPEIVKEADAQMLERFNRYTNIRENLQRDNTFLETLYGGKNLKEIQKHLKVINILGFRAEAHDSIIDRYYAIDKEIKEAALRNPEVKQFLSSLGSASTFIWRDIENSKSKSYHSFGIAMDINPKKLGNKQIYWNWTSNYNEKWYSVPYSQRWMVHPEVIRIFEKYGFVWGGKWLPFDNMHFEYRPEILIFSGKEVAGL